MNIITDQISIGNENFAFNYRKDSKGDNGAIKQIFDNQCYNIKKWKQGKRLFEYHLDSIKTQPSLIIDAGANIGASVLYFNKTYPGARVFSIEPNLSNWDLLQRNTSDLDVLNFHGAIADKDGVVALLYPGRSDMGFTTKSISIDDNLKESILVKSICVPTILSNAHSINTKPLILKIDIEGGEDALFSSDASWLRLFPLVIIELHDWMLPFSGSSKNFLRAISQFEFDFIFKGENIFLFNRDILNV